MHATASSWRGVRVVNRLTQPVGQRIKRARGVLQPKVGAPGALAHYWQEDKAKDFRRKTLFIP